MVHKDFGDCIYSLPFTYYCYVKCLFMLHLLLLAIIISDQGDDRNQHVLHVRCPPDASPHALPLRYVLYEPAM